MYSSICSLVIGISSILRYITLLWRYLLVWPQADRTEDPVLRLGLRPECFQGPAPAQIVGEIFGGDTMEAAHPFFEPSVIGIHVVDVKIGHLRAGLARGRQDVDRDRSLEGEGNDGGAAIAAELVGRRADTPKGGRGRVQLGHPPIDRRAARATMTGICSAERPRLAALPPLLREARGMP